MGNGDHRLAAHQGIQTFLYRRFDFAIQRRSGLIQNQDGSVFQQHAGDGDALALPAGEFDATLADLGIESVIALRVGQRFDEFRRLGLFDGAP